MIKFLLASLSLLYSFSGYAIDWSKPDLGSSKSGFMTEMHDIINQCATMNYDGSTNLPVATVRYNRATDVFEEYNVSSWIAAPVIPPDNSVTSAKIVDATITASDIGSNAVNSTRVVDGSLLSSDLAADAATRYTMVGPWVRHFNQSTNPITTGTIICVDEACAGNLAGADGGEFRFPMNFVAKHMSLSVSDYFGGSLIATLYKDGSSSSEYIELLAGNLMTKGPINAVSFSAGQGPGIRLTTVNSPPTAGVILVYLWGYFTTN